VRMCRLPMGWHRGRVDGGGHRRGEEGRGGERRGEKGRAALYLRVVIVHKVDAAKLLRARCT
jgi:hypothetical protein